MSIEPYTISVPEQSIKELHTRLKLTKWPSQLQGTDAWDFGTPVDEIRRLVDYWTNTFDWRKAEAKLNSLPNFATSIPVDGFGDIKLHFVHQKSAVPNAIPLLFSHGWPGSFIEVSKLLPLLTAPPDTGTPAFHVVAPSLPNFAFSDGVDQKGFSLTRYAEACHKLMQKLGYAEYVTQGGDWGFSVTRAMGLQYPQSCKASHINLILAPQPTFSQNPIRALIDRLLPMTEREKAGRKRSEWFWTESYGYNLLQSTKPQTIAFALADSPVGLLAWIYEKLRDWSGEYPWTEDEILTWVSIYVFSNAGPGASARIYHEATHPGPHSDVGVERLRGWIPTVKLGLAHFPEEHNIVREQWGHALGPVVQQTWHDSGGHFAAWENPGALAEDLRRMFGRGGPCYGIVRDMDGYGGVS